MTNGTMMVVKKMTMQSMLLQSHLQPWLGVALIDVLLNR